MTDANKIVPQTLPRPPKRERHYLPTGGHGWNTSNSRKPHQGKAECARRVRQMAAGTHGY